MNTTKQTAGRGNGQGVGLDGFFKPLDQWSTATWGLSYLHGLVQDGEFSLDPDYQRGRVWTSEQQKDYLGFLLEGGRAPEIVVRELPNRYEVVDGKQRCSAILSWWANEVPARLSEEHGHREIWASDLSAAELAVVKGDHMRVRAIIVRLDRKETLALYIRLNRGGTPHTEQEIERVRALYAATP